MPALLTDWRIRHYCEDFDEGIYYVRGIIISGHERLRDGTDVITTMIRELKRYDDMLIAYTQNTEYHLPLQNFRIDEANINIEPNDIDLVDSEIRETFLALTCVAHEPDLNSALVLFDKQYGGYTIETEDLINDIFKLCEIERRRIEKYKLSLIEDLANGETLIAIAAHKAYYFDFVVSRSEEGDIIEGRGYPHVGTFQDSFLMEHRKYDVGGYFYDFRYFPYQGDSIEFYSAVAGIGKDEERAFQIINTGYKPITYQINFKRFILEPNQKHRVRNPNYQYEPLERLKVEEKIDLYNIWDHECIEVNNSFELDIDFIEFDDNDE